MQTTGMGSVMTSKFWCLPQLVLVCCRRWIALGDLKFFACQDTYGTMPDRDCPSKCQDGSTIPMRSMDLAFVSPLPCVSLPYNQLPRSRARYSSHQAQSRSSFCNMASTLNVSYISSQAFITVGVLVPALSVLLVGIRFFIRRWQKAKLMADDWLLIPALVSFPCSAPLAILSCQDDVLVKTVAHG